MKRKQCPACRSLNTTVKTGPLSRSLTGQAFKNRICSDCGTVWRPPTPKWMAIIVIVLGIAAPLLQSGIAKASIGLNAALGKPVVDPHSGWDWLCYAVSGMAVAYGLLALFGKAGRFEILRKAGENPK
jgi:hypothetical protein